MKNKSDRISKIIANLGVCSRRDAEKLIISGRVKINNTCITNLAHKITLSDQVHIDGQLIARNHTTKLWKMYKPPQVITTHNDPEGRTSIMDILPQDLPRHIMTIGRLDFMTEGLILLTNDGDLSRFLEHPSNNVSRIYMVKIFGKLTNEDIYLLHHGLTVNGVNYAPIKCKIIKTYASNQLLEMELTEGKNREIRNIIAYFGNKVSKLIRISYGPFTLGNLHPGDVMQVNQDEIRKIKN